MSITESDMGYTVDEQRAIQDTHEAWQSGIGWHTSTSRYVELPDWFSAYVQNVKGGSWPAAALSFDRQCRRNAVREM